MVLESSWIQNQTFQAFTELPSSFRSSFIRFFLFLFLLHDCVPSKDSRCFSMQLDFYRIEALKYYSMCRPFSKFFLYPPMYLLQLRFKSSSTCFLARPGILRILHVIDISQSFPRLTCHTSGNGNRWLEQNLSFTIDSNRNLSGEFLFAFSNLFPLLLAVSSLQECTHDFSREKNSPTDSRVEERPSTS